MPKLAGLLGLFCAIQLSAVENLDLKTFDEGILDYLPPAAPEVQKEVYELWCERLKQTYSSIRREGRPNIGDYWNLARGFQTLGADTHLVRLAFLRASQSDPEGWAEYMEMLPHTFDRWIPAEWAEWEHSRPNEVVAEEVLEEEGGTNPGLRTLLRRMDEDDKRYRKEPDFLENPPAIEAQRILDRQNMARLDSLIAGGEYIGRSRVGPELEHVAWAVIQHSTLQDMERYLPVVARAVARDELHETPLRMLIDRWLLHKEGTQVFGSQEGVPLAPKNRREELRALYNLE